MLKKFSYSDYLNLVLKGILIRLTGLSGGIMRVLRAGASCLSEDCPQEYPSAATRMPTVIMDDKCQTNDFTFLHTGY